MKEMKRLAGISAEAVLVIQDQTSGFSVQEERAGRKLQRTDAYVPLAKYT